MSHGGDTSRLPQNVQEEARRIKSDIEKRAARMEAGRDPSEETEADISPEEQERLGKDLEEKARKAKEEEEKKRQEKEKQEAEKKRQEEEARATDGEEEVPRTAAPGCELVNVEVEKTAEGTFTVDQNRLDRVLTNCQTDDQLLAEYPWVTRPTTLPARHRSRTKRGAPPLMVSCYPLSLTSARC